jgi:hypothetical protein
MTELIPKKSTLNKTDVNYKYQMNLTYFTESGGRINSTSPS